MKDGFCCVCFSQKLFLKKYGEQNFAADNVLNN